MARRRANPAGSNGASAADPGVTGGGPDTRGDPTVAPRSLIVTATGVRTGEDFAALMSALMGDVIEGTISPNVANAACNAGRQLLRITEMQYRYVKDPIAETLVLAPGDEA